MRSTMEAFEGFAPELKVEYRQKGWWRDETVVHDFLRHVASQPDKVAVVSDHADGSQDRLTYAELDHAVRCIATGLRELGVGRGDVVSFQLPNWWQLMAIHLACARLGAITNAILPILRHRELRFILERTESRVVIAPNTFRGFDYGQMLVDVQGEVPSLESVYTIGGTSERTESFEAFFLDRDPLPSGAFEPGPDADSPAQLQFTSGTTGEPKGVLHTFNTMWAGTRSVSDRLDLGPSDVLLAISPMSHTVGFYFGCSLPLMEGMTVVLQDVWSPDRMVDLVVSHNISWTMVAPTFLSDICRSADERGITMPSLTKISCAGAPVPPPLIDDVRDRLGAVVLNAWGMTEWGAVTTTTPSDSDHHRRHTDGTAADWVQLQVVDDVGTELPVGEKGRLLIRGASQLMTYFKRPDLFADAFHDGWFDTGDLAYMDEAGHIRICGRSKDIIIRGAENIPVVEVEAALMSHPLVREVALVAVPDDRMGEKACAVIVPTDQERPPTLTSLCDHLEGQRMAKQFWPEYMHLVDELPKTATGKIQKFKVREAVCRRHVKTDPQTATEN